jgi:hypothetical protein
MKQIVPFLKSFVLACTTLVVFTTTTSSQITEFVFTNPLLVSGSNGADGAVYLFPSVSPGLDAHVTIKRRSHSQVALSTIDLTTTGFSKALQPQIRYGSAGSTISSGINYWMEFEVKFINNSNGINALVSEFDISALDIDGNGGNLREFVSFYRPASFKVETNTQLTVSDFIPGSTVMGTTFRGPSATYSGVDTNATRVMATVHYTNTGTVLLRMGGVTNGSASSDPRMYSIWFRDFQYDIPSSLPVKLLSFTGNVANEKVLLSWTVASNEDADYYELEKSSNGRDFVKAAMIFPTEKIGTEIYNFKETLQSSHSVYRLKLIDKNGTISYSKVLSFQTGGSAQSQLQILGNPSGNQVAFSYKAENTQIQVRIYDMNGRTITAKAIATAKGMNLISLDVNAASGNGMYILEVIDGTNRTTSRFFK